MNLIELAFFKLILKGTVSIAEAKAFLSLYEDYEEQCLEILNEYIARAEWENAPKEKAVIIEKAI